MNRKHNHPQTQPFLKWAGGKGRLLKQYAALFPQQAMRGYYEPFVGSGAVFFYLRGKGLFDSYHLSDINADLITCYRVVRDDLETLITLLAEHKAQHNKDYYYTVRSRDRDLGWETVPDAVRAARMIYLNKTCYNGLWRVNSQGHFNVPVGRYKNPAILDEERLRAASAALQGVELSVDTFEAVRGRAEASDFVYFDPPYVPLSSTAKFTSYAAETFGEAEQRRLAQIFAELAGRGVRVMLSNSDVPLVRELYGEFRIKTVQTYRAINSASGGRGKVNEVVVSASGLENRAKAAGKTKAAQILTG